jgi:hypothetical protein
MAAGAPRLAALLGELCARIDVSAAETAAGDTGELGGLEERQGAAIERSLAAPMLERFGVMAKRFGDLVLFKYHQSSMTPELWARGVAMETRGTVFRWSCEEVAPSGAGAGAGAGDAAGSFSVSWECVALPWGKFFNHFEAHCPLREDNDLAAAVGQLALTEKADGTCMQLWWNGDSASESGGSPAASGTPATRGRGPRTGVRDGQTGALAGGWQVSTLGRVWPDEKFVQMFGETFAGSPDLFADVFGESIAPTLVPGTTYLFELCCQANRIVTSYATDRLFLLGARRLSDGGFLSSAECDALCATWSAVVPGNQSRLVRPEAFLLTDLGVANRKDLLAWVERQAREEERFGNTPEGFVLQYADTGEPVAKVKNLDYVQKHHLHTADLLSNRNVIIERFFADTLDDIDDLLDAKPPLRKLVAELKAKVDSLEATCAQWIETIKAQFPSSSGDGDQKIGQKEFSAAVFAEHARSARPGTPEEALRGFILGAREALLGGERPLRILFWDWLQRSYNNPRLRVHWKDTKVEEITDREKFVHKNSDANDDDG